MLDIFDSKATQGCVGTGSAERANLIRAVERSLVCPLRIATFYEGARSHQNTHGRRLVRHPPTRVSSTVRSRCKTRTSDSCRQAEQRPCSRDGKQHTQAGGTPAMKYLIIVETMDTGFSAYSPDLPGCIATGADRAEVEREMGQAIEFQPAGSPGGGPAAARSEVLLLIRRDSRLIPGLPDASNP